MPESYISIPSLNETAVASARAGFQHGAQMEHEDFALHKQQQAQAFREQMLKERLDLQMRNSWALQSARLSAHGAAVSAMTSVNAAKDEVKTYKNAAFGIANDRMKGLDTLLAPNNINNLTEKSRADLDLERTHLRNNVMAIAGLTPDPNTNNGFLSDDQKEKIHSWATDPASQTGTVPVFTPEYYASQAEKQRTAGLQNTRTEVAIKKAEMTVNGMSKEQQRQVNAFQKNGQYSYQAAVGDLQNALARKQSAYMSHTAPDTFKDPSGATFARADANGKIPRYALDSNGEIDKTKNSEADWMQAWKDDKHGDYEKITAAEAAARNKLSEALPQLLNGIENPTILRGLFGIDDKGAADIVNLVQVNKAKYNNLRSVEDIEKFLDDTESLSTAGAKAGVAGADSQVNAVGRLRKLIQNKGAGAAIPTIPEPSNQPDQGSNSQGIQQNYGDQNADPQQSGSSDYAENSGSSNVAALLAQYSSEDSNQNAPAFQEDGN